MTVFTNAAGQKVWRYSVPSEKYEGWAICFIDEAGCLSILSDYDDYAYRWNVNSLGAPNLVRFLADTGADYILGKIAQQNWFDPDFADGAVAKALEARDGEDADCPCIANEYDLYQAVDEYDLYEQADNGDLARYDFPPQARMFMEKCWPKLVELFKEDIERGDA